MQALILCRGNISGIRSNPEGYGGAYLAPRPCNILNLVRAPGAGATCNAGKCLLRRALEKGFQATPKFKFLGVNKFQSASW